MRSMTAAAASALFTKQLRERRRKAKSRRKPSQMVRTCQWCFTPFSTGRDHAKWCSGKCRTAASRQSQANRAQGRLPLGKRPLPVLTPRAKR